MTAKRNIPLTVIFSLFTLFCMVLIFLFSVQMGDSSAQESMSIYGIFIKLTGFDFISHNTFRKFAHFSEYAALCFGFAGSFCFGSGKAHPKWAIYFTALYAVSDEIHQYFVPERACRVFDLLVDCLGGAFGMLIFAFLYFIISKLFQRKKA